MRVLVTGGAGFIGSHLVDRLLASDHEVAVVDDLSTGRRENLAGALDAGASLVEADVCDAAAVGEAVARARPELIFHLAAQVDVRRSVADPQLDLRVNVAGTLVLLEAARTAGVRRLVYACTGGAIYGEADAIPTPEEFPPQPMSPYGHSKYAGEGYCGLYARLYGLRAASLRLGNVYGPRQDPLGEAGVVAILCGRLLEGAEAVVYGDGRQTRDFIHVADVVDAFLAAAQHDGFGPYNVGTGRETSVLELVDRLRAAAPERGLAVRHEPERPGEVRRSCLDPERAARELGWSARVGLDDGLRDTLGAVASGQA